MRVTWLRMKSSTFSWRKNMSGNVTDVKIDIKYDVGIKSIDGLWYVVLSDKPIGDGYKSRDVASVQAKLMPKIISDVADMISDAIDAWYKARENP
jgi:hypothetical protein